MFKLECTTDEDCYGESDTCVLNICFCGSNAKCSGRTDKCHMGACRCGDNEECPETQTCSHGECQGN